MLDYINPHENIKYSLIPIKLAKEYFSHIFKFLSSNTQTISILEFTNYWNFPYTVSKQIFLFWTKNEALDFKAFFKGMSWMFFLANDIDTQLNFLFNLLDYDSKGYITHQELKIFLSHLMASSAVYTVKEVDKISFLFFCKTEKLKKIDFISRCKEFNKNKIYNIFFTLFNEKRPFNDSEIEHFNYKNQELLINTPKTCVASCNAFISSQSSLKDENCETEANENYETNQEMDMWNDFENSIISVKQRIQNERIVNDVPGKKCNSCCAFSRYGDWRSMNATINSRNKCKIQVRNIDNMLSVLTFHGTFQEILIDDNINSVEEIHVQLDIIANTIIIYTQSLSLPDYNEFHKMIYIKNLECLNETLNTSVLLTSTITETPVQYLFKFSSEEHAKEFITIINTRTNYKHNENNYTIKHKLGKGSFGIVYLCERNTTGEEVAMKIIKKDFEHPKRLLSLHNELDIMNFIAFHPHDGLIHVYETFENSDYAFIIMESIEDGYLLNINRVYSKNPPMLEKIIPKLFKQISAAVHFYSSFGIIHRDLKIENVLLRHDEDYSENTWQIKIIDFGLSCIASPNEKWNEKYGTLANIPPEMINNFSYNKSADIWGFGLISYRLWYGSHPFQSYSSKSTIHQIWNTEPQVPEKNSKVTLSLNYWFEDIIIKCWEKDPNRRIKIERILNILEENQQLNADFYVNNSSEY